ncbi:MAG: hypothetical protein AAF702_52005 [Chloroflexota bacterium]
MMALKRWWWMGVLALLLGGYWLLPIEGTVLVSSQPLDPDAIFPQFTFNPPSPQPGEDVFVSITDNVPWTHVKLTVNDELASFVQTQALPQQQIWNWTWRFTYLSSSDNLVSSSPTTALKFYRDCDRGCRLRDQRFLEPYAEAGRVASREPGVATKLCVAFPNPNRNWHGRSGWVTDLTYAVSDVTYWQIDALAQRVQKSLDQGLRVLVRVDYMPEQSLPPADDAKALANYLSYLRQLARDDRLNDVYGLILGTGFNALDSNQLSPNEPTTAEWVARLFNGEMGEVTGETAMNNVVQAVRPNNPNIRLLVGPVRPWIDDQDGSIPYEVDAPWLNYMNTLVAEIDKNTRQNSEAGVPLAGPDGFALNAPGRPHVINSDAPSSEKTNLAEEPTLSMPEHDWNGAQAGFRVYQEWLAIINRYPTTKGKPAFITSTNTFTYSSVADDEQVKSSLPSQNYPKGWLTTALNEINKETQIQSLCWFLDLIPGDQRWQGFSLSLKEGQMADAAQEFDILLQGDETTN